MRPEVRIPIESALSTEKLFELGVEVARKGQANPHTGLVEDTTFVGRFEGKRYQVTYKTSQQFYRSLSIVGRDLSATIATYPSFSPKPTYSDDTYFKDTPTDIAVILHGLVPEETPPEPAQNLQKLKVYTIYEPDRSSDAPTNFHIVAEDEAEAREKYLNWCEETGNFIAMNTLQQGIDRLGENTIDLLS